MVCIISFQVFKKLENIYFQKSQASKAARYHFHKYFACKENILKEIVRRVRGEINDTIDFRLKRNPKVLFLGNKFLAVFLQNFLSPKHVPLVKYRYPYEDGDIKWVLLHWIWFI